jgi:hypothetical protein
MTVTVTLQADRLAQLLRQIPQRAKTAVDETADEIRDTSSQLAPRDTGSLSSSMYVSNGDESDYAQRSGQARSQNPDAIIVQEVRPEFVLSLGGGSNDNAYLAVVGAAVAHGIYQELGTRFIGSRAFMIPATEGASTAFVAAMSKIADL